MNQMTIQHLAPTTASHPARIAVICSSWHGDIVDQAKHALLAEFARSPAPPGQVDQFEVPVLSAVLTPRDFHEHADHLRFFSEHFVKKGAEVARACLETVAGLRRVSAMTA